MKKDKTERKFNIIKIILLCVACIILLMILTMVFSQIKRGDFGLESAMRRFAEDGEDYCMSRVIDETRGVGYINYDCTPINRITKGIQKCKGQYIVFADRINRDWVVDENSKQIIW